jgi:hypothetical protein
VDDIDRRVRSLLAEWVGLVSEGRDDPPLQPEHWLAVAAIYQARIVIGNATFETIAAAWEQWDAAHRPVLRLVALDGDYVIGWEAASPPVPSGSVSVLTPPNASLSASVTSMVKAATSAGWSRARRTANPKVRKWRICSSVGHAGSLSSRTVMDRRRRRSTGASTSDEAGVHRAELLAPVRSRGRSATRAAEAVVVVGPAEPA